MPIFSTGYEHRKRFTVNLHRFSCTPAKRIHLVHMISGFAFHTTKKNKNLFFWYKTCLASKHAKRKENQYNYLQVESKIISHAQLEVTFVHKYLCSSYTFAPNRVPEENTSLILRLLLLHFPSPSHPFITLLLLLFLPFNSLFILSFSVLWGIVQSYHRY